MDQKITISPDAYKELMVKLMAPIRGWLARKQMSLAKSEPGTYVRGQHDAFKETRDAIDEGIKKLKF